MFRKWGANIDFHLSLSHKGENDAGRFILLSVSRLDTKPSKIVRHATGAANMEPAQHVGYSVQDNTFQRPEPDHATFRLQATRVYAYLVAGCHFHCVDSDFVAAPGRATGPRSRATHAVPE